jgi:hypothetical protein
MSPKWKVGKMASAEKPVPLRFERHDAKATTRNKAPNAHLPLRLKTVNLPR